MESDTLIVNMGYHLDELFFSSNRPWLLIH